MAVPLPVETQEAELILLKAAPLEQFILGAGCKWSYAGAQMPKHSFFSLVGHACLLITAVSCAPKATQQSGSNSPEGSSSSASGPVNLTDLRARESKGLGEMPVVGGDGTWRGALLAKSAPQVQKTEHGFYQVKADIGASTEMECTVFASDISGGVWLSEVLGAARKSVQMVNVEAKNIEVIGNHVGMDVVGTYTAEVHGAKAVGEIKFFVLSGSDRGFVCYHDELGYTATFGAAARLFAKSFELMHEPWQVEGVELARAELDGHPMGFNQHYWVRMPNGVALTLTRSLLTRQSSPGELSTEDEVVVKGLGADNRIVSAEYHAWQGNTESYDIKLKHLQKGEVSYEGAAHGKAISGTLVTKDKKAMESDVLVEGRIAAALKKKQPSTLKWELYSPDSDPTRLQTIEAKIIPKERRMESRRDKMVSYDWLDDQGGTERTIIDYGRVKLNIVRLVRKGR